jgi:hypothetical protein
MDLAARLQQLEDLVREAKSMPLSSSALLNREEVLELVEEMKESLPDEIKQARWVVKDREELLGKARAEAERLVEQGHDDQLRLAQKEEVLARAREEAERIVGEADERARAMRLEAEDYVDAKLAQFEIVLRRLQEESQGSARQLARLLDQVEVGRQKLRGEPMTEAEQRLSPDASEGTEEPQEIDIDVRGEAE